MGNQSEALGAIHQDVKLILDWLEGALEAGQEIAVRLTPGISNSTSPPPPPASAQSAASTAEQRRYIREGGSTPLQTSPHTGTAYSSGVLRPKEVFFAPHPTGLLFYHTVG